MGGVAPLMLVQHLLRYPVLLPDRHKSHRVIEVPQFAEWQAIQYRQIGMLDQEIDDAPGNATPLAVGQDVDATSSPLLASTATTRP